MTTRLREAARSLIDRQDFWKNAGTLPGEYDNLVDALAEPEGDERGVPLDEGDYFREKKARAEGFMEGVEASAKVADEGVRQANDRTGADPSYVLVVKEWLRECAHNIRALAPKEDK